MERARITALLRELGGAAERDQAALFQHVLGEILDMSAEGGMSPPQLQILGAGLCREFGMDEALARQVVTFVAEAPGDLGMRTQY